MGLNDFILQEVTSYMWKNFSTNLTIINRFDKLLVVALFGLSHFKNVLIQIYNFK